MGLWWWVLVCEAVLGMAGTTVAPAASESSGHVLVAPVVSSDMGTRAAAPVLASTTMPSGARAHFSSEEPIMSFTLRLLDGDPSAMKPLVLSPGSILHLEAKVRFSPGTFLKIYVDQCYGSSSKQLEHSRRIFMVVNSRGCLHGQKLENVSVQHGRGLSALQLTIPAPVLEDEPEEVYVHCLLTAWGPGGTWGHTARSCFYRQATASWHNAEDPSQSTLCHCCDTGCPPGDTLTGELPGFPGEGTLHQETVGPLLVRKEKVPWYEAPCRTVKRFLLAGLALVGSALVTAALVGGLLGLALATWRLGRRRQGWRRPRRQCPFQAELQSVLGTLVPRESEKEGEAGPDYHSLAQGLA